VKVPQNVEEKVILEGTNSFAWVSENILSKLTELGPGSPTRTASAFEGMMMDRVVAHDNDQMN
jgi:hypothetical protein